METVITKSKRGLFIASYIIILVLGILFFMFGLSAALLGTDEFLRQYGILGACVGAILMGGGIGWLIYLARLPKVYITFESGKLRFYNGLECSPSEVNYCNCRSGMMDGAMYNCGKLIISVRNTEYKFKFVEGVEAVTTKINALKTQAMAVESVQKHIAEKNEDNNSVISEEENKD